MTELGQTNPYGKSIQGDPSPTNSEDGRRVCIYIHIFNTHSSAASKSHRPLRSGFDGRFKQVNLTEKGVWNEDSLQNDLNSGSYGS